jgi:hypothetical protein
MRSRLGWLAWDRGLQALLHELFSAREQLRLRNPARIDIGQ